MQNPKLIFYTACVVALMTTIGTSLPYPILAPIFVDAPASSFNNFMGLPPKLLLGLALAINPFGILLGSMVMGMLSDRFGRRRVLMLSLGFTVLGHAATAIALYQGWYVLFLLARFATGLTEGNVAVLRAILADLHPQLDRTRSFALFNSWLYMGWLLGPLAGGAALPLGASVPFWMSAGIITLCAAFMWHALPADPAPAAAAPANESLWQVIRRDHALQLLSDPALRQVFWLQLAITMGVNGFYEFTPLWLVEFARFNSFQIAMTTAALCLVMTLSSTMLSKWPGKAAPLIQARRWALLVALGLMLQPWLPGWFGVAGMVLLGIPISMYNAIAPAWFSGQFGEQGQGRIMGLLTTTFCLGNVLIALLGSVLTLLDTRLIFTVGGMICLFTVWMLGRWITGHGPLGHLKPEAA
jgi:MFS transporter, DHA1 family, tetracycline resistance protein